MNQQPQWKIEFAKKLEDKQNLDFLAMRWWWLIPHISYWTMFQISTEKKQTESPDHSKKEFIILKYLDVVQTNFFFSRKLDEIRDVEKIEHKKKLQWIQIHSFLISSSSEFASFARLSLSVITTMIAVYIVVAIQKGEVHNNARLLGDSEFDTYGICIQMYH